MDKLKLIWVILGAFVRILAFLRIKHNLAEVWLTALFFKIWKIARKYSRKLNFVTSNQPRHTPNPH